MIGNIYKLYGRNGYTAVKIIASHSQVGYIPVASIADRYIPTCADIPLPDDSILISAQWMILKNENKLLPRIPKVGRIDMKYLPFFRNAWDGAPWTPGYRSKTFSDLAVIIHLTQGEYRP